MDQYPPNSDKSKAVPTEEKDIQQVTSAEPIRRKKGLGKQFRSTFLGGDAKSAMQYVVFGVLIPAAKDALADAGAQGIERLIFGESRSKRRTARPSGPDGYVGYNKISSTTRPRPELSRRARSTHDFDEIVLTSRTEAEEVIDQLFDIVARYNSVSVSDLYALVGVRSNHVDQKWGWTDLRGAGVARVRNGFLLDLPEPEPLD